MRTIKPSGTRPVGFRFAAQRFEFVPRRGDGVALEIADSGGRRQQVSGGGFGIEGMRERAAVYGGTLEAGPRGDGFAVRAWLPAAKV